MFLCSVIGSGSLAAMAVFEDRYKQDMEVSWTWPICHFVHPRIIFMYQNGGIHGHAHILNHNSLNKPAIWNKSTMLTTTENIHLLYLIVKLLWIWRSPGSTVWIVMLWAYTSKPLCPVGLQHLTLPPRWYSLAVWLGHGKALGVSGWRWGHSSPLSGLPLNWSTHTQIIMLHTQCYDGHGILGDSLCDAFTLVMRVIFMTIQLPCQPYIVSRQHIPTHNIFYPTSHTGVYINPGSISASPLPIHPKRNFLSSF